MPTTQDDREKRETAKNVSSALFMRVLRYPFLIASILVIPKLLGPEDYGRLALLIAVVTIVSQFLTLGATEVFGRYVPGYLFGDRREFVGELFYPILALRLVVTGSFCALAACFYPAQWGWYGFDSGIVLIVATILLVEQVDDTLFGYIYGSNQVGLFFSRYLFRTVFRLLLISVLYVAYGFDGAVHGLLLSYMATLAIGVFFVVRIGPPTFCGINYSRFRKQLKFGLVAMLPGLMLLFQQQIGPIILGASGSPAKEIGFFDLANQAFLVSFGLLATGCAAYVPIIARHRSRGTSNVSGVWPLQFMRYALSALIIVIVTFYSFGEELIDLLLGSEFGPTYKLAVFMLAAGLTWAPGLVAQPFVMAAGNIRSYLVGISFSTISYLFVAAILIGSLGAWSLVGATLTAGITFSLIMLARESLVRSETLRLLARLAICAIAWAPLFLPVPWSRAIHGLAYVACLLIFLYFLDRFEICTRTELRRLWDTMLGRRKNRLDVE